VYTLYKGKVREGKGEGGRERGMEGGKEGEGGRRRWRRSRKEGKNRRYIRGTDAKIN